MSDKLTKRFTKSVLAIAVAAIVHPAVAQDADSGDVEEIVVKGVRSSLVRSLESKREANAVVDSITSEELGRFPDGNVAESLSHIPGITVSRNRSGEADYINIRGLGPEFSVVTLNNRVLATDDTGRNLSFDVLPAELINGADVWKSAEARNVEGSIGGLVNLKSLRPLNGTETAAALSFEGDYNSVSEATGAKLTGIYSNKFADDTLGFLVGVTHQAGTRRSDEMFDNYFFGVFDEAEYDVNNDGTIQPNEESLVIPGSYALGSYESDFKRSSVISTLQWRPSDRVEITADIMVTELNADATGFTQSFYMVDESAAQDRLTNIVLDGNVITAMDVSDLTMEIVTLDDHRTVDTTMYGLNGIFDVTDNLTLTADAYQSKSVRDSGGKNTFVVAGAPGAHSGRYQMNNGGLPDFVPNWTGGRSSDDFGNDDFAPHWAARDGDDVEDTITGFTLNGNLQLDFAMKSFTSIDFGVSLTDRAKTKLAFNNYADGACNYCGYPYFFGDVGATVTRKFPYSNFFGGESGNFPRSFPIFNIPAYGNGLAASDGQTLTDYNGDDRTFGANESALWAPIYNPVDSYDIAEDTASYFVQANFEGDGWYLNAGVRIVETDVVAKYSYNEILTIDIVDPNVPNPEWIVTYSDSSDQTDKGNYSKTLPALNFGMNITDDLLFRVSYAEAMSRPTIDQLAPLTTDNAQSGVFDMNISGNPDIEPVFSEQYDVSLEWYFADDSVLYATYFQKDLEGFITSNTTQQMIAGESFRVTQPINGDSAKVDGIEIGFQKFFNNGFGFRASYGTTDSSTVVEGESAGALVGLADESYSVSIIYEAGKISSQITLDYTGDLVADSYSPLGDGYHTTTEEVSMVSASFRYTIFENGQIYLEGFNLLDESNRTFQGRPDMPSNIQLYGRSVIFGGRYNF